MKLLVNKGQICKELKLSPERVLEVLDNLGVKPLTTGKRPLWRWVDIAKALGADEKEAASRLQEAVKPKKVNVCGIWFEKTDADRIEFVAQLLGIEKKEFFRSAVLELVEKLDSKKVNGVGHGEARA